MGLGKSLLAELHGKIVLIWHLDIAKEGAFPICKEELDSDVSLKQTLLRHL